MSSRSPLTISYEFRRSSSSASTITSMDIYTDDLAHNSSSSLPLRTPLDLTGTRRNECMERQASVYLDGTDRTAYNHRDKTADASRSQSCHTPYHLPLPPLMSKFATYAPQTDTSQAYDPSPFPYASRTTYSYPQGSSSIADDSEEYDLESMDIHIRETYFATSAERGRWLSSPIASRVQSKAIPPMRGHSSPIKSLLNASLRRDRRRKISRSVDATSPSQYREEDVRYLSPLPPSSPLTSPMSNLSFLSDCDDDSVVDPRSNSDDRHSLAATPELSMSSTTCTSPVELARTPSPHDAPSAVPASHPINSSFNPARFVISCCTSSCSPKPTDFHVHAPGATDFESDDSLSPLSQFELDLPEAELPLSDTMNKLCPGTTLEVTLHQDGLPPIHSLSTNSIYKPVDVLADHVGSSSSNKQARCRKSANGNSRARRTKKCATDLSGSRSSDMKKGGWTEGRPPSHLEPPTKRSKLSHRRDALEGRGARSLLGEISQVKRSTPRAAVDVLKCPRKRKSAKPTRRARLHQPTPSPSTTSVSMDKPDREFHASLTGMIIEALATSRATSMNASALYLVLTQSHPFLAAERPKGELLMDIAAVLEAGQARCGMFEKVDGSGETRHRVLERRWFYVPERDEDRERASLISALMPRQKRNETKKYKQYYYRPLDKISKWDPEDAP